MTSSHAQTWVECDGCGLRAPYLGSRHEGSELCRLRTEEHEITKRGLVIVSPPASTSKGHTNRVGTIAVCEVLGLPYKLVPSKAQSRPWVCVTPGVERTLRTVNEIAHCGMLVIPEAARQLVDRRELIVEFDTMKRLGADDDALFDLLALAGVAGPKAQFEAKARRKNPRRSDLSIARAWERSWARMRRRARDRARLKTKP